MKIKRSMNRMKEYGISAPWYTYRKKLAALFELDESVTVGPVTGEGAALTVDIAVSSGAKADALGRILKKSVDFGNVTLTVNVDYAPADETPAEIMKTTFAYNRLVRRVEAVTDAAGAEHAYVVFEPDVVQFFNDDLTDYRGNFNGLAEDVARELFETDASVNFCTADLTEN